MFFTLCKAFLDHINFQEFNSFLHCMIVHCIFIKEYSINVCKITHIWCIAPIFSYMGKAIFICPLHIVYLLFSFENKNFKFCCSFPCYLTLDLFCKFFHAPLFPTFSALLWQLNYGFSSVSNILPSKWVYVCLSTDSLHFVKIPSFCGSFFLKIQHPTV